jgi:cell shape-determining protein MreD
VKAFAVALGTAVAVALRLLVGYVDPVERVVDPFLVVAVVAGLSMARVPALFSGLFAGSVQDAFWSGWVGLHGFTKVSVAYAVAALGQRLDLSQAVPRMVVLALAAAADRGLQLALGAALAPGRVPVPPVHEWLLASLSSVILGMASLSVLGRLSRRR